MDDQQAPKVSIIIPSHNHAEWIVQTLVSVFTQTLTDWELIVIDDASHDDSWSRITTTITDWQRANRDRDDGNVITLRHSSNQGAPATLNEGMAMASGEYLAILNSDDVWDDGRLQRLYEHASGEQLDFVATKLRIWDKYSRLKNASEQDWLSWYQGLCADWHKHHDFLHTLLRGNFLITTSNFFFRRSVYERLGGFSELRYVHDYEYVFRMYQAGCQLACLWDDVTLSYRLHDSNTIRERPLAAIQENMALLLGKLPELSAALNASRLHAVQSQLQDLYRYTNEEWESAIHWRLVAKEKELFPLIESRDEWVMERDAVIAEQKQYIEDRNQWLAEREQWIAERDAVIAAQKQDIVRQQGWIAERESWLSDRDAMISKRDQWVAERDDWVAERDAMIAQLQQEHHQLLHSRSYRLGNFLLAPLRSLRDWLQHRKQRKPRFGHA